MKISFWVFYVIQQSIHTYLKLLFVKIIQESYVYNENINGAHTMHTDFDMMVPA